MLRNACRDLIALRLGNRTDLDAAIVAEMQLAQEVVMEGSGQFTPWFLETELATSSCEANEERLALPTDFLAEVEEQPLWLYDSTAAQPFTELKKDSYDVLLQQYPEAGRPRAYALTEGYFLLKPTPDVVYSFKTRYYAMAESLSSNIENDWLKYAPDLMIAVVGEVMAGKYLQNPQLAATFKTDVASAWARLYVKHESRQHNGRTYGMGDD